MLLYALFWLFTGQVGTGDDFNSLLAAYLMKYEDYYDGDYAYRYRGEIWFESPDLADPRLHERLQTVTGVVLVSHSRNFRYVAMKEEEPKLYPFPGWKEELTYQKKLWRKFYRASRDYDLDIAPTSTDDEKIIAASYLPQFHPHALALTGANAVAGRRTDISALTKSVIQKRKLIDSIVLPNGRRRETWGWDGNSSRHLVDFSDGDELPVRSEVVHPEQLAIDPSVKDVTLTKWKKLDDMDVPYQFALSSKEGKSVSEYKFEIEFLSKEKLAEKLKNSDPAKIIPLKGTLWWDEYNSWFPENAENAAKRE
ncbi:MAG: hypothetical protein MUC83_01490 [Pirellula sp.]|nr:hypothetical protein [Pirellula sp.]